MYGGLCSLSHNPEARRQGIIKLDGCRRIADGASASIPGAVNSPDINTPDVVVIICDIVNARSARPPHQFNHKRIGRCEALSSVVRGACDPTRMEQLHQ
jgi:hypothetical protein